MERLEDHIQVLTSGFVQQRFDGPKPTENEVKTVDKVDETKADSNNDKVSSLNPSHNRIRQLDQESTIAFFASRSSHAEHLGQNQPIVFDRIVTNIGLSYHNATGIFIAPVTGVYVFSTTILAYSEYAGFHFVVNKQVYSRMYADGTDKHETLSQTVILNHVKGDDVAIQSRDSDKFVNGYHYSIFSGFLLAPTEGNLIVG